MFLPWNGDSGGGPGGGDHVDGGGDGNGYGDGGGSDGGAVDDGGGDGGVDSGVGGWEMVTVFPEHMHSIALC